MNCISGLKAILEKQLGWHKSRIDFFAQALIGLMICRTINFREIAIVMPSSKANVDSNYRRIQRFFANFEINFSDIACWIFRLFFSPKDMLYISIDRTNWFWGKSKINIFMLSICYEGVAIPIYWKLLNKAGNSSGDEQIELLERFVKHFGKSQIKAVLADREFPNEKFIGWLVSEEIPFFFRVKRDVQVYIKDKKYKLTGEIFSKVKRSEQRVLNMCVNLYSQKLWLSAARNERDELMIICTNDNPRIAIASYLRRWEIECLFQSLKGRGFRFEDTRVVEQNRIEQMLALLAIGFAWAHKTGEWKAERKPIFLKKIRKQKRPQYTYFRYGLDYLREKMNKSSVRLSAFKRLLRHLVPSADVYWLKC